MSSGTYYLRARYYQPTTGRFTQADPLFGSNNIVSLNVYTIQQTANLYAFVTNNPVRFIDPFGLQLRDYANAHGTQDINWNANTKTATLTVNGITKSFTAGVNGVYIDGNGRMQVSQSAFNNAFNLGINASFSGMAESFNSPIAAAASFATIAHPLSIQERQEYGALIVQNANSSYSVVNVTNSAQDNILLSNWRNGVDIDRASVPIC